MSQLRAKYSLPWNIEVKNYVTWKIWNPIEYTTILRNEINRRIRNNEYSILSPRDPTTFFDSTTVTWFKDFFENECENILWKNYKDDISDQFAAEDLASFTPWSRDTGFRARMLAKFAAINEQAGWNQMKLSRRLKNVWRWLREFMIGWYNKKIGKVNISQWKRELVIRWAEFWIPAYYITGAIASGQIAALWAATPMWMAWLWIAGSVAAWYYWWEYLLDAWNAARKLYDRPFSKTKAILNDNANEREEQEQGWNERLTNPNPLKDHNMTEPMNYLTTASVRWNATETTHIPDSSDIQNMQMQMKWSDNKSHPRTTISFDTMIGWTSTRLSYDLWGSSRIKSEISRINSDLRLKGIGDSVTRANIGLQILKLYWTNLIRTYGPMQSSLWDESAWISPVYVDINPTTWDIEFKSIDWFTPVIDSLDHVIASTTMPVKTKIHSLSDGLKQLEHALLIKTASLHGSIHVDGESVVETKDNFSFDIWWRWKRRGWGSLSKEFSSKSWLSDTHPENRKYVSEDIIQLPTRDSLHCMKLEKDGSYQRIMIYDESWEQKFLKVKETAPWTWKYNIVDTVELFDMYLKKVQGTHYEIAQYTKRTRELFSKKTSALAPELIIPYQGEHYLVDDAWRVSKFDSGTWPVVNTATNVIDLKTTEIRMSLENGINWTSTVPTNVTLDMLLFEPKIAKWVYDIMQTSMVTKKEKILSYVNRA